MKKKKKIWGLFFIDISSQFKSNVKQGILGIISWGDGSDLESTQENI